MRSWQKIMQLLKATLLVVALWAMLWLGTDQGGFGALEVAQAAPDVQVPIFTPTPQPDGRIIYIVKTNDTLLGISLVTGVPVDKLRALNNLTSDTIFEGQQLLLGLAGPVEVTPTAGPPPTPTPILPTPSPRPGQGTLCILLFNDLNGVHDSFNFNGSWPAITDYRILPVCPVCAVNDFLCFFCDPDANAFYRARHATSSSERCMIPSSIKSKTWFSCPS
jgi:hypothetical protein